MRLELATYNIGGVKFGSKTAIEDRTLMVSKDELTALLEVDEKIGGVKIELARPRESVRIINVLDVLEPRAKIKGPGTMFPGMFGRLGVAGEGRTVALKGIGVVNTGCHDLIWESMIDMAGPGARLSPFYSSLNNVVIVTARHPDVDEVDYVEAAVRGALKTSEYLAKTAETLIPDEVEIYDLEPLTEMASKSARLPKVAYLYQIYSHRDMRDTYYYGEKPRHLIPTLIHPNEVFDGAIITGNYDMPSGMKNETIAIQNHPIIRELYRRHNRELIFAGVVITNEHARIEEKEKSAVLAAKMIKNILGADAAIISETGGGHPNIDLMLNCQTLERQGVKTVIVVSEESSVDGKQFPLTMMVPEADAIVSTGNINEEVNLPAVERIIGGTRFRKLTVSPTGPVRVPYNYIPGSTNQIGGTRTSTTLF